MAGVARVAASRDHKGGRYFVYRPPPRSRRAVQSSRNGRDSSGDARGPPPPPLDCLTGPLWSHRNATPLPAGVPPAFLRRQIDAVVVWRAVWPETVAHVIDWQGHCSSAN
jgi:hypothetical protein